MRAAKVRANQRRDTLRVTLASIGDAVITTDIKGRVTYVNAVAASLTGWAKRTRRAADCMWCSGSSTEETRQPVANPVTRALDQGVVERANHTVLIRKHGGELPDRRQRVTHPGRARPGLGMRADLPGCTAQRRDAQEKAKSFWTPASWRRSWSLPATPSSASRWTAPSRAGMTPPSGCSATRPQEAVGRHISLVIPPERLAEEDHIIRTLKAGQRIDHFETERVRKDGRRILVSLTVSPIKDDEGNIVGASKVVRDVTLQRRADERERRLLADAAAANAKFQAFFEQGALLAVIMELDGTIVAANRLSWEGCGYRREQIVGKRILGRSLVGVRRPRWRSRSRRRPRRRSPARRSAARRLTSWPTAASGSRTSRSCRSKTRRERCCSWPRRASTSPTASAPRPIGRSS